MTSEHRTKWSYDIASYYVLVHLGCLGILGTGVTWSGLRLALITFVVRFLGLSIGYHRYFAHRAFKTSRPMQLVLAALGSLSLQRGPLWWAETHRAHHRHADTESDIHSPKYHGIVYAHFGWFMDRRHRQTDLTKVPDLARYPELVWMNGKLGNLTFLAYAALMFAFFRWEGLVWGVCVSGVLAWEGTHVIQSLSHTKVGGYRRFATPDGTRNHWYVALFTLGEWHNNHHHDPSAARQGIAWWEVDIAYGVLKAMSWLGLVWDLREPRALKKAGAEAPV
jgi:stearoyl-CoA desaturase (delta-9 desaturase)